jgi:predicted nucleotidyltransferase
VTQLESILRRAIRELEDAGVKCALIGGLAVSVRTEPRFTRDADLAVAVTSDDEAERIIRHVTSSGFVVTGIVEQNAAGRLATARLSQANVSTGAVLDLLFASSGIEPEIVAEADAIEVLPGLTANVARTGHLIALKLLSRDDAERPQDVIDLRALVRVATVDEIARARKAIALITSRNFHRGRDLTAAFDRVVGAGR